MIDPITAISLVGIATSVLGGADSKREQRKAENKAKQQALQNQQHENENAVMDAQVDHELRSIDTLESSKTYATTPNARKVNKHISEQVSKRNDAVTEKQTALRIKQNNERIL